MATPAKPQYASAGGSSSEIHDAALRSARPAPGLSWLDVGCGTGEVLRMVRCQYSPARLTGIDVIDWLDGDLRDDVELVTGPAEQALAAAQPADRVLMVETIEHLEGPWTSLRSAARLVKPGGILVVTTPNVASLRHRIELVARGQLTSFRPDNEPHLGPILPHVVARILREEGLVPEPPAFAGRDVLPKSGGRLWPGALQARLPRLTSISVLVAGRRPA